jgi:hypothetical protein
MNIGKPENGFDKIRNIGTKRPDHDDDDDESRRGVGNLSHEPKDFTAGHNGPRAKLGKLDPLFGRQFIKERPADFQVFGRLFDRELGLVERKSHGEMLPRVQMDAGR